MDTDLQKIDSNRASILLFCGGMLLVILAAFAPLFTWISMSIMEGDKQTGSLTISGIGSATVANAKTGERKTLTLSAASRPEGGAMLGLNLTMALVLSIGFLLAVSGVLERKPSEQILNLTLLVGVGWGILLGVWNVGWILKMVTFSHTLQKELGGMQLEAKDGSRGIELMYKPFPGAGLLFVLLASLFIAYLFSQVAYRLNDQRKKLFLAEQMKGVNRQTVEKLYLGRLQLLFAELGGVLLGGLVLWWSVQPWTAEKLWREIEPLTHVLARRG